MEQTILEPGRPTVVQLKLFKLYQGNDETNGYWWQWRLLDCTPLSIKSYKRENICGSDGFDSGNGSQWFWRWSELGMNAALKLWAENLLSRVSSK
jgi:hypothetical protein